MPETGVVEYLTAMASILIIVLIGLTNYIAWKRSKRELRDYYVAGGVMRALVLFAAAFATAYSAFTFLGGPGYIYRKGIAGIIILSGIACITFILMTVVGSKIWLLSHKYNLVTPADLLALRFPNKLVRLLAALICVIFPIFYTSVQLIGAGYIVSELTNNLLPYEAGIILFGLALAVFIAFGGQRGVIWQDVILAIIFIFGLITTAVYGLTLTGPDIFAKAYQLRPDLFTIRGDPQTVISVATITIGTALSLITWPHLWMFYYTARDKRGVYGIGAGEQFGEVFILGLLCIIIALEGVILFPGLTGAETDKIPLFLCKKLAFLAPIVAIGVLAAALSTADSIIITTSAIITKDIYKGIINPKASEQKATLFGRVLTGVVGIVSMIVALHPPSTIVDIVINLSWPGLLMLLPPLIGAVYWRRATTAGAVASLITGLITVIITTYIWIEPFGIYSGFWGLIVSVPTLIIISYLTKPPASEIVTKVHDFITKIKLHEISTAEDIKKA